LGCTHFPLLKPTLAKMYPQLKIIDSAATTAKQVHELLHQGQLYTTTNITGDTEFLATDSLPRFQRIAERFLQRQIFSEQLSLISLTPQAETQQILGKISVI